MLRLPLPFISPPHHHRRRQPRRNPPNPLHLRLRRRLYCTPSPLISSPPTKGFIEELDRLLILLPPPMRHKLDRHPDLHRLVEIVMDLGRRPLARFPAGDVILSDHYITVDDLQHATSQVGDFAVDNRAGISRTLHRISAIRNRKGGIVGLTCRVGRAVPGSANMLRDLVEDGGSLLLIGPPGVGKTTIIRDIARMLADDYKKRVIIVDTSNEIGGDGDIPHAGIGSARRLQVPNADMQHKVLIEAVENHMPQVIIIDEIGTKLEAMAASTIAQRGIQLVATAHGVTIENLIMNPSLEMLVGGIQSVTLGDEEASRRGGQKTILERKGPSTFTCSVEIISKTELQVHRNLEATVDALLSGRSPKFEVRGIDPEGSTYEMLPMQTKISNEIETDKEDDIAGEDFSMGNTEVVTDKTFNLEFARKLADRSYEAGLKIHLFVYGIMETSVLQAFMQLGMEDMIVITDNISEADAFLAVHSKLKKNSQIQAVTKSRGIPVYVTKTNSLVQVTKAVRALTNEYAKGFKESEAEQKLNSSEKIDALEEARLAIEEVVIPKGEQVLLLPRLSHIVSIQIGLVERYKLKWEKVGREPHISLRVLPFHPAANEEEVTCQDFAAGSQFDNLLSSDNLNSSQNGVARLPFLPE